MADITQNPDYQLVMKFLQNIRPGDMDQESSDQLMMIGQRIQAGGALTDREREMFEAVVGATDRFPVEQMDSFPQGTNPDIMKDPSMGAVSEGEMRLAMDTAMPTNLTPEQMDQFMAAKNAAQEAERRGIDMQGERAGARMMPDTPRPQMAPDAGRVMSVDDAIAAGFVTPTRPQARPTAPMRPQMRPTR
jgi:hypothetical protein